MGFLSAFGPLPAVEVAIARTSARAFTAPARLTGRYMLYSALRNGPQMRSNGSAPDTLTAPPAPRGSAASARLRRAEAHAAPPPIQYDIDPTAYMTALAQRRRT
jgi:hypothetical protein